MRYVTIYSLDREEAQIHAMQSVSLDSKRFGLSLHPALIGTPEWWRATKDGTLARSTVSGAISALHWEGMGDWPTCDVTDSEGRTSRFNREGDVSRYVEGLRVRFTYVFHPWKSFDLAPEGVTGELIGGTRRYC